jgi:hypothetical protein
VHFYRFYLLTASNHIALRQDAYCANDAHAIATAADFIGHYPAVEIWNDERRVIRLDAADIN